MIHDITTSLSPADIFARAKSFFAERVPHTAVFPEREESAFLLLRGQGGEEIAIATQSTGGGTRVRGSTLMFDQALGRFLTTLPLVPREQP